MHFDVLLSIFTTIEYGENKCSSDLDWSLKGKSGVKPVWSRHCNRGVETNTPLIFGLGRPFEDHDSGARRPAFSDNTAFTYGR
jgi:hypothetical protein